MVLVFFLRTPQNFWAGYANMQAPKQPTSSTYHSQLLDLQKSVPLSQLGYRNPVVPLRRRESTPGWLEGSKVAMPGNFFPLNGRLINDTTPTWYRGF